MASVVSSMSSLPSGFSPMDEDGLSWDMVSSDNEIANPNHQEMASFGLLASPSIMSPSMRSQGSWGIIEPPAQQQRMLQTPSPISQLGTSEPSSGFLSGHMSFGHMAASARDFGSDRGTVGFDTTPLAAQRQGMQGHTMIEAPQQEQGFGVPTAAYPIGQSPIDFNIFNDVSFWSGAADSTADPQPQSMLQYNGETFIKADGSISWDDLQQQPDAPAPEQMDPPSRSSIERLTPSSGSSVELSPKQLSDSLRFRQTPKGSKADGVQVTRRRHHNTSRIRKPQKKKKSTSPPLSTSSFESMENPPLTFCNMSPDNWGKGGFDGVSGVSRSSQKGRKGALSEDTRANALAVRQRGACFCCHVRKVRCDKQRPCRNCKKVCNQLPQILCWRFEDFTKVLFPAFTRKHFAQEEMSRFVSDNVQSFTLNGVEQHCTVSLSSGFSLMSKLVVKAEFFTAKMPNSDVMQHWFRTKMCTDQVGLAKQTAVPIGLDMDGAKLNELRRKLGEYAHDISQEPTYPWQLTASDGEPSLSPRMSRKMLQIIQRYAQQSKQHIVKRALGILTMYYVIRKHLTLTPQSILALQPIYPVDATCSDVTPRLLNRQIKAEIDGFINKGVAELFEDFSKRLKRKSREEWAPCLAAFMVMCMLMEDIVAAADVFVKSDNKVEMRKIQQLEDVECAQVRDINNVNEDIENLPFNQVKFLFHQIYQTHSKDASARTFNPLMDGAMADNSLDELGDLDHADLEMVRSLRDMLQNESLGLCEMSKHPPPQNEADDYMGRLWSKFLLSFQDSEYIFGSPEPGTRD